MMKILFKVINDIFSSILNILKPNISECEVAGTDYSFLNFVRKNMKCHKL